MTSKNKELAILLAILAVAVFFRFYKLGDIPPGLYPDEAMNGVNALNALDSGNFKIFYPENNGREGLFINIQAVSIKIFGVHPWTLRLVSAIFGVLAVLGLYLLSREIFGWQTASISSFLMAVSFWHVNFSRIGFRAIMVPFFLVFAFYFMWRGLKTNHLTSFFFAGVCGGLGFYTYPAFWNAPLIAVILFLIYWSYLKKDFSHSKYEYARNKLLRGFALITVVTILIALPIAYHFWSHQDNFLNREGRPISIFAQENPLKEFGVSTARTLGMFWFRGDGNQRHNIPGSPELPWLVSIFFAIGLIKEIIHWSRRKHGHFSPAHTFILSWFFVGLLPGFMSIEAPHALRAIAVIPVVMLITARGIWWFFENLNKWASDLKTRHESNKLCPPVAIALIIFLSAAGFTEYYRYFVKWGQSADTRGAFTQKLVDIANFINQEDNRLNKFIIVNEGDVMVDDVSVFAQPIKFLTLTYNKLCAENKNIVYLRPEQFSKSASPRDSIIIPIKNTEEMTKKLAGLKKVSYPTFNVYFR